MSVATEPIAFAEPVPTLSVKDAVAMIVGIVVGAGIFRTPSLFAANVTSETSAFVALGGRWRNLTGGGALLRGTYHCVSTHGRRLSLSHACVRQAAFISVCLVADRGNSDRLSSSPGVVFGDYASQLLRLGRFSPSIYAALVVISLTSLNMVGVRQGTRTQPTPFLFRG